MADNGHVFDQLVDEKWHARLYAGRITKGARGNDSHGFAAIVDDRRYNHRWYCECFFFFYSLSELELSSSKRYCILTASDVSVLFIDGQGIFDRI